MLRPSLRAAGGAKPVSCPGVYWLIYALPQPNRWKRCSQHNRRLVSASLLAYFSRSGGVRLDFYPRFVKLV